MAGWYPQEPTKTGPDSIVRPQYQCYTCLTMSRRGGNCPYCGKPLVLIKSTVKTEALRRKRWQPDGDDPGDATEAT